jgi:hypothetical protein
MDGQIESALTSLFTGQGEVGRQVKPDIRPHPLPVIFAIKGDDLSGRKIE